MPDIMNELTEKLSSLGFPVVTSSWGSDDVQNHQPVFVVSAESSAQKDLLRSKMEELLSKFSVARTLENRLKIIDISGMGSNSNLPKFGFEVLSGHPDEMEEDTGIDDFDFY